MKKFFLFILIVPFIATSCRKSADPAIAEFTIEVNGDAEVGKEVHFINNSRNAVSYDWDFGDGYGSSDESPDYIYNSTGTYTVTLTATGEDGVKSEASADIDILIPTLLVVEVREWNDESVTVPGASILVYESLQDWQLGEPNKALYEGFTDNYGMAVFSNLGPYRYYLDVWEQNHDNWDLGTPINGILYIETPSVMSHNINWFVAYVDVVDHGKSTARSANKDVLSIRKIERKIFDPKKTEIPGNLTWEELYAKRVNK
ncbi:MAG TPA: PKD domain-containing protein [Bacteroidales bacterium]|jgi:hypothetical protein|nr:PKD domain-containing protein [Bacteroidales bacterium]